MSFSTPLPPTTIIKEGKQKRTVYLPQNILNKMKPPQKPDRNVEMLLVVGCKHIRRAPFWITGSACAVKCPYRKGFWVYVLFLPSSSKVRQISMCCRYLKLSLQSYLIIFPKDVTCSELLSLLTFSVLNLYNFKGHCKNSDDHDSDHRNLQPDNNVVI